MDRRRWIRRMAPMLAALGLAVMIFGGIAGGARAEKQLLGVVRITQQQYVKACGDTGGTATVEGPAVDCDYGGGRHSKCNFDTNKCVDIFPAESSPVKTPTSVQASATGTFR